MKRIKEKQLADSLYGNSYWKSAIAIHSISLLHSETPGQSAMNVLNQIIDNYPNSPMKEKAATMIDVLGRRDSIENYLTNLKVERAKEDSQIVVFDDTKIVNNITAAG